ncbi:hypothetical protein CRENBAI_026231 [Crenichthys baileyi]|uniref:Uncharacterized protein n=1 Tax=Crenichthys baileyi TaxID=28760 RepID=A0AAV9RL35_9TELE
MTASRAAHHQARPIPPDSASSPSPPVHERDTCTSRVPGQGMAKTANPEHTEPTRKHPANGKPHPSTRPRSPTQAQSPATPALPHHARRSEPPRTGPPPQHHIIQYSPPKNKVPRESAPPRKEDPQHAGPRTCPTPIPLPEAAPQGGPPRGPQKAREPTEPKPKPIRKPRPVHPETNPGPPAHLNHADPSEPPPPDRKGTGISNRNLRQGTRNRAGTTQDQTTPTPIQGQPPIPTPEGNLHPPQHSNNSQST